MKTKTTLAALFTALSFTAALAQTVSFEWAKQFGDASWDEGFSITIDASGNVYTTGYFNGSTDFDPGADTFNMASAGMNDIFISKLDGSGNFLWAKQLGDASDDVGSSIAIDGSGNVYTTGYFQGTADFDPGVDTFNMTSAGGSDIFISKLDASGNFLWTKQLGGVLNDFGSSIAIDVSGNIYTTGRFQGTVDFDPGIGTFNINSAGSWDIYITKLDSSGNLLWAKQLGGTSFDWSNFITFDPSGNVYTTGFFVDIADFDPGADTFNMISISAGLADIFISKLDTSGNFLWAKQFGGALEDIGYSVAVDTFGNVYTTGSFRDTADFNPIQEPLT